ncbi:unnamed protein product [Thelazia callipaeda]|uniref:KID domain-containing protein n=1 Tax=Thelazia callipaeda TaxID=103827 RepID=A0A0N5D9V2_THECL|nr:unnamed protein product [Thelazia callipaeda]
MSLEPSILHNPSTSEPEAISVMPTTGISISVRDKLYTLNSMCVIWFTLKFLAKVVLQNQSSDEIISDDEARRRREQLNRRPSYRQRAEHRPFISFCEEKSQKMQELVVFIKKQGKQLFVVSFLRIFMSESSVVIATLLYVEVNIFIAILLT